MASSDSLYLNRGEVKRVASIMMFTRLAISNCCAYLKLYSSLLYWKTSFALSLTLLLLLIQCWWSFTQENYCVKTLFATDRWWIFLNFLDTVEFRYLVPCLLSVSVAPFCPYNRGALTIGGLLQSGCAYYWEVKPL